MKQPLCVILVIVSPIVVAAVGPSFLAVGDWGGDSDSHPTTSGQVSTAVGMSSMADKLGVEGILLLGDNFYAHGISSTTSSRFQQTFENVYTTEQFKSLPFYIIAGNHDYLGNVNAEVEYKDTCGRWHFPSLWYSLPFSWSSSSGRDRTVQLLMIDTVNLVGISDDNCKGCELPGPSNVASAEDQWAWIEDQLKSSTADFLWVAGHYPIYSAGDDGTTKTLVKRLLPMLKQYGAHYISGHDHMLEHIIYDGVEMFITGMGRECCYGTDNWSTVPSGAMKYMISGDNGGGRGVGPKPSTSVAGGFASVQFDDAVAIAYYNQDGDVLYAAPAIPARSNVLSSTVPPTANSQVVV